MSSLAERQAKMKAKHLAQNLPPQRNLAEEKQVGQVEPNRNICISCNRRVARVGSPFCSRCTQTGLTNQLRDTLPGGLVVNNPLPQQQRQPAPAVAPTPTTIQEDEIDAQPYLDIDSSVIDSPVSPANNQDIKEINYTRQQVSKLLGVSPTTILRWERKGRTPQPMRIVHNNQCVYTEEMVQKLREYKDQAYLPPSTLQPQSREARLPVAARKQAKISRAAERAVASRIGSFKRIV